MSNNEICEWAVKRFKLPMSPLEFWELSPTGELHHYFAAMDLRLYAERGLAIDDETVENFKAYAIRLYQKKHGKLPAMDKPDP